MLEIKHQSLNVIITVKLSCENTLKAWHVQEPISMVSDLS